MLGIEINLNFIKNLYNYKKHPSLSLAAHCVLVAPLNELATNNKPRRSGVERSDLTRSIHDQLHLQDEDVIYGLVP